MGRNTIKDNDE